MAKLNIPLPSKGLTVDRPAEYVDSRSAISIQNMEFNRSIIRKRVGTAAMGTGLGERVMRMFELQVGNTTRLFRIGLTKVEVYNKATDTWTSVTGTALTGTQVDVFSYGFPTLGGDKVAIYSNGVDPIRKCTVSGMDAVLGGAPPLAKYVRGFGPYAVLAYVVDSGNDRFARVQWSDTGDPESWTPASNSNAGSEDLLEDPEDITGMGVFGSFLTIHKSKSIYLGQLVSTASVFRFDRKATGVGTVAEATIQNLPSGEQIFLASDGIRLFNGITAPLINSPIQDELREEMNPTYLYKAQSIFVAELDEYWVCVPAGSDTEPRTVYKYNWRTQQVYKDDRPGLTAMCIFLNTQQDTWADHGESWNSNTQRWNNVINQSLNPLVAFGTSAGDVSKRTSTSNNDVGATVSSVWETKDFVASDLGIKDIDRIMRWKGMKVWAKGSSVSVYYSLDGGSAWTLADTLALGSDYPGDSSPLVVYFDAVNSRIRFRFVNASAGETFTLKKYQIDAAQREVVK